MLKPKLLLVQSFPAHSDIAGLISFLTDFFEVEFINLPGLHDSVPPLTDVSYESFADYVQGIIDRQTKPYILGGFSFGAQIINYCQPSALCQLILHAEPLLGASFLHMSRIKRGFFARSAGILHKKGRAKHIRKNGRYPSVLSRVMQLPQEMVEEMIIQKIDAETFFACVAMIMGGADTSILHSRPHILMINPDDKVINASKTIEDYHQQLRTEQLRVVLMNQPHHPPDTSYEYFKQSFADNTVRSIFDAIDYWTNKN